MKEIIFHQIFWTIISFSIFYSLMHFIVIKKIQAILATRESFFSKLFNELDFLINSKKQKEKDIKEIYTYEIPAKQTEYISKEIINEEKLLKKELSEIEKNLNSVKNMQDDMQISTKDIEKLAQLFLKQNTKEK